ncbi:hypothetical protein F2P79_000217 [Pimephales promelas]|nr:hypothetical protein F2P79_000217 [Pimephales promelas]
MLKMLCLGLCVFTGDFSVAFISCLDRVETAAEKTPVIWTCLKQLLLESRHSESPSHWMRRSFHFRTKTDSSMILKGEECSVALSFIREISCLNMEETKKRRRTRAKAMSISS